MKTEDLGASQKKNKREEQLSTLKKQEREQGGKNCKTKQNP